MTPSEIHDQITWQRARELERLRYENYLLHRLLKEGRRPARMPQLHIPNWKRSPVTPHSQLRNLHSTCG